MRSLFPPTVYHDPAVFTAEQERLFGRLWQYAGVTLDLQQSNDWITADVGSRSVVVQNFEGELRAFANVCSHRFARIHCEASGNGKLRCPYHGWIYNAEGVPYSIPARPRFDDLKDRREVEKLALQRYDLAVCGQMVFIRAPQPEGAPSLEAFLGESYAIIEEMSNAFGRCVEVYDVDVAANWKATVENTLEGYHVGFVHENTLKKLEKRGDDGMDFRFYGLHSAHRAPVDDATAGPLRKLVQKLDAPFPHDGYIHQLAFPNLTITTTLGSVFGVQHFRPRGPGSTQMRSQLFETRRGPAAKLSAAVLSEISRSAAEFARAVFAEDRGIVEEVQAGLTHAGGRGILSDEELRVARFQQAYVELMGGVPGDPIPIPAAGPTTATAPVPT